MRYQLAAAATEESQQQQTSQTIVDNSKQQWYALIANSEWLFHNAQNEALAEQLRERKKAQKDRETPQDFFLVSEPAWLDKFPEAKTKLQRPCAALVSTDKVWITFVKLRLDRVLKLQLDDMTRDEVCNTTSPVPDFGKIDNWTAPYSSYRAGWWEAFMLDKMEG